MNLCRDSQFLNRVVNDPSVFPFVSYGQAYPMDTSALLADERNLFLANEYGGFLFVAKGGGEYEVHTQFLPEGRAMAMEAGREALAFIFTMTDCKCVMTYVDRANRKTRLFTLKSGFRKSGEMRFNGSHFDEFRYAKEDWVKTCQ